MFTRRKMLLKLIQLPQSMSKIRIVKLMFLISKDSTLKNPPYYFIPYKHGPFSFQLYSDLSYLEQKEYIVINQYLVRAKKEKINLDKEKLKIIRKYFGKFKNSSDKTLINYTYSKYPEYTHYNSIIEPEYKSETGIVTIGYEGLTIDQFLMKLISHKIGTVVDVRKNAFSRKYGFSSNLEGFLSKLGIGYVHFPELGIPSGKRKNLESFASYQALFREYESGLESKLKKIREIFNMGMSEKIALMCFESDPNYCHRKIIGIKLEEMGAQVVDL
jgi:uncharacterized protein (DUF488 family)